MRLMSHLIPSALERATKKSPNLISLHPFLNRSPRCLIMLRRKNGIADNDITKTKRLRSWIVPKDCTPKTRMHLDYLQEEKGALEGALGAMPRRTSKFATRLSPPPFFPSLLASGSHVPNRQLPTKLLQFESDLNHTEQEKDWLTCARTRAYLHRHTLHSSSLPISSRVLNALSTVSIRVILSRIVQPFWRVVLDDGTRWGHLWEVVYPKCKMDRPNFAWEGYERSFRIAVVWQVSVIR